MEQLRKCSFCGRGPTLGITKPQCFKGEVVCWTVVCTFCGSTGPIRATLEEAKADWQEHSYPHQEGWDTRVMAAVNK